jgi:hypothetical protein
MLVLPRVGDACLWLRAQLEYLEGPIGGASMQSAGGNDEEIKFSCAEIMIRSLLGGWRLIDRRRAASRER